MENHGHIMAEVGGSNPPIATLFFDEARSLCGGNRVSYFAGLRFFQKALFEPFWVCLRHRRFCLR
jgi:hypothetical protein